MGYSVLEKTGLLLTSIRLIARSRSSRIATHLRFARTTLPETGVSVPSPKLSIALNLSPTKKEMLLGAEKHSPLLLRSSTVKILRPRASFGRKLSG